MENIRSKVTFDVQGTLKNYGHANLKAAASRSVHRQILFEQCRFKGNSIEVLIGSSKWHHREGDGKKPRQQLLINQPYPHQMKPLSKQIQHLKQRIIFICEL